MTRTKRAGGIAIGVASVLGALASLGCGDSPFAARGTDAGGAPSIDAGADRQDGALGGDGGPLGPPEDPDREGFTDEAACFDGIDNDDYEGVDCSNTYCASRPICCVGASSEACCGAPAPVATWPDAAAPCADGPVDACPSATALGTPFGLPLPAIVGNALVPNGEPTADSGLVLGARVSPRTSTVRIAATIAAPMGCTTCVDGVAVGLAEGALGDARVTPLVAVQVSGSRGEWMLVSGNAVLARAPLADAEPHPYVLTTHADGRVELDVGDDGTLDASTAIELPARELEVVVYGRTTNRGPGEAAARLTGLSLATSGCDMPAALRRGLPTLAAPVGAPFVHSRARAPSIALRTDPADARLAFESQGSIWLARPDGAGGWVVPADANPALLPGPALPQGASDPSLIAIGDRWVLFVTVRDASGRERVQVVSGLPGFAETFDPSTLRDVLPTLPAGMDGLDGATAFRDASGEVVLVARASRTVGEVRESEIVLLRAGVDAAGDLAGFALDEAICGTGCDRSVDDGVVDETRTLHAPRHGVEDAFDRDEVAAPSLVRGSDGIYRLYFAGRRGTRWSIGLLVSYDLEVFRAPSPSAVLAASGEGRDALGVFDPEPTFDAGRLLLLHTGTDGVSTYVLAAEQRLE